MKSRPNIWQLQSRQDIQALTEALEFPDPEVRMRAAIALRVLDATQTVPALKKAIEKETDAQTRIRLLTVQRDLEHRTDVEGLVSVRDVHGLIQVLSSRRSEHAVAAARALGQLGDRTAVEPLVMLFQNASASSQSRLAAAEALLELKSAPAVVTLLGALRRDSWEVRRNAAAVLGQIQAIWAIEPLAAAMDDSHPIVRRTAAAALRRIGTTEAMVALRAHLTPDISRITPPLGTKSLSASTLPEPERVTPPVSQPATPKTVPPPPVPAAPAQPSAAPEPAAATIKATPPVVTPGAPPTRTTQPVKKLIAFLKRRAVDEESGRDHSADSSGDSGLSSGATG